MGFLEQLEELKQTLGTWWGQAWAGAMLGFGLLFTEIDYFLSGTIMSATSNATFSLPNQTAYTQLFGFFLSQSVLLFLIFDFVQSIISGYKKPVFFSFGFLAAGFATFFYIAPVLMSMPWEIGIGFVVSLIGWGWGVLIHYKVHGFIDH